MRSSYMRVLQRTIDSFILWGVTRNEEISDSSHHGRGVQHLGHTQDMLGDKEK